MKYKEEQLQRPKNDSKDASDCNISEYSQKNGDILSSDEEAGMFNVNESIYNKN